MNKITFIGAGSMAEALIAGMVTAEFSPKSIVVTNKSNTRRLAELNNKYHIQVKQKLSEAVSEADILVLAVKPKDAHTALEHIKSFINKEMLIISIMAGIPTTYIEQFLNRDMAVIRAMPNTSSMVGLSATAIAKGTFANDEHVKMARQMFETVGIVEQVSEEDIHIATAIAGSGPAYFYYIVEAMEEAAIALGLSEASAKALINQTLLGAAQMLNQSTASPTELRKKITSPNGTTEAGIASLETDQTDQIVKKAIQAAYQRSIELGNNR